MRSLFASIFIGAIAFASICQAEDSCDTVLTATGHDLRDAWSSSQFLKYVRSKACDGKSVKAGFDTGGSIDMFIEGLPLGANGRASGNYQSVAQFCEQSEQIDYNNVQWSDQSQTVVPEALNAWLSCKALAREDVNIQVSAVRPTLLITLRRGRNDVRFEGITSNPDGGKISCTAPSRGGWLARETTIEVNKDTRVPLNNGESWIITCTRKGIDIDGSTFYPETHVTISTSGGGIIIPLPADTRLSPAYASEVREELAALRRRIDESCFDTGWVVLSNNQYMFSHKLNVRPRLSNLWVAKNNSGEGAFVVDAMNYRSMGAGYELLMAGTWLGDVNENTGVIYNRGFPGRFENGYLNETYATPHYRAVVCR